MAARADSLPDSFEKWVFLDRMDSREEATLAKATRFRETLQSEIQRMTAKSAAIGLGGGALIAGIISITAAPPIALVVAPIALGALLGIRWRKEVDSIGIGAESDVLQTTRDAELRLCVLEDSMEWVKNDQIRIAVFNNRKSLEPESLKRACTRVSDFLRGEIIHTIDTGGITHLTQEGVMAEIQQIFQEEGCSEYFKPMSRYFVGFVGKDTLSLSEAFKGVERFILSVREGRETPVAEAGRSIEIAPPSEIVPQPITWGEWLFSWIAPKKSPIPFATSAREIELVDRRGSSAQRRESVESPPST